MTVEELEIIVTARVEEALKEVVKIVPAVKQSMKQAQEAFSKVDTKTMTNKIHQAVQFMKKKMQDFKKSSENNEVTIKVNNKDAQKQINQVQKQIDSLQEKINARQMKLNIVNPQIDSIVDKTRKEVTPEGINPNSKTMDTTVNSALSSNKDFTHLNTQAQKLYTEIEMYNNQLSIAKGKMSQLKQEINQTGATQNKLGSFFSAFKNKIEQAKPSVNSLKNAFGKMPKITQNVTNNISKMGSGVRQGIKHVMKYALALFSLRGIYSVLSNAAQSWLSSQNSQAQQLSANIEYMKYAMGSVFASVIEYITNLVFKLMKAIQSLVYAFSGVNIFAKATASSMKSTAKSAKDTGKSLSGVHSEINNVSENKDSDNGAISPSIDLTHMDTTTNNWADGLKSKLQQLFKPVQESWNTYGGTLMTSISNTFNNIKTLGRNVATSLETVWSNGTGKKTIDLLLQGYTAVFNIIGNISEAFSNAWQSGDAGTNIIQNLWNGFNNIFSVVIGIYQAFEEWTASESFQEFANAIISICETLSGWFEKITGKLKEIWDNGGKETFTKILEFVSKVIQAIDAMLKALSPVVDFILNIVTPVIQTIIQIIGYVIDALSGVLDFIIGIFTGDWERAWSGIGEFFKGIWNAIGALLSGILNFIVNLWNNVWSGISSFFQGIWNGITSFISGIINGIKNTISTALNAISYIWSNIWNGISNVISNVWNGIWGTIRSVINWILRGIEGMVNGVIRGVNWILGGISNIANAVGGLVGMSPINLRLGTISLPRLAKGNVAYDETVAVFGEYSGAKNNPEITTPQNVMAETFENVLSNHEFSNQQSGAGEFKQLIIQFGSTKVAIEMERLIQQARRQNGTAYATI